jgi:Zn-dependent protease
LSYLALVQVLAFVINILPVPGLDGFGAMEPYLSSQPHRFAAAVWPFAPMALFAIIISVPVAAAAFVRHHRRGVRRDRRRPRRRRCGSERDPLLALTRP